MENIKFLSAENEIQKIYSNLGLIVPVGDLSTGKAPAVQPLPSTSTQDSITFNFNVMSGAEVTGIEYTINGGEAVQVTPQKGVVSITLEELEHNSGPYEIELTAFNEIGGGTSVTQTADLQPFTDWATANEVLEGNKFIGEDGQEHVGTLVPSSPLRIGHVLQYEITDSYIVDGVEYTDGYVYDIGEDSQHFATEEDLYEFLDANDYVILDPGDPCQAVLSPMLHFLEIGYDAYDIYDDIVIYKLQGEVCDSCQELGCNEQEQSAEQ